MKYEISCQISNTKNQTHNEFDFIEFINIQFRLDRFVNNSMKGGQHGYQGNSRTNQGRQH